MPCLSLIMVCGTEKTDDSRYYFIGGIYINEERDVLTLDGMNDKGLYYDVMRLSDGKVKSTTCWNIENVVLFPNNTHEYGTARELREKGISLEDLFKAVLGLHRLPEPVMEYYE